MPIAVGRNQTVRAAATQSSLQAEDAGAFEALGGTNWERDIP